MKPEGNVQREDGASHGNQGYRRSTFVGLIASLRSKPSVSTMARGTPSNTPSNETMFFMYLRVYILFDYDHQTRGYEMAYAHNTHKLYVLSLWLARQSEATRRLIKVTSQTTLCVHIIT